MKKGVGMKKIGLFWGSSSDNTKNAAEFTHKELDNYAVMHMSQELLNNSGISNTALSKAIETEYADNSFGFKSLARFKKSFQTQVTEKNTLVSIVLKGNFERLIIYPDNGKIYVNIKKGKGDASRVQVRLAGIGGHISLSYRPSDQTFISGTRPILKDFVNREDIKNSHLNIDFPIEIRSNSHTDCSLLQHKLRHNDPFQRAISTYMNNASDAIM